MSLERQLADYGKHLHQVIGDLEFPATPGVVVRPTPEPLVGRRSDMGRTARWVTGRRGLLIVAAACAAALAIALPLWFVFRGEESSPVVTVPPVVATTVPGSTTTSPATSTTTVPTTTTAPATAATAVPIESLWDSPFASLVAVSAQEAWAFGSDYYAGGDDWSGIAHYLDGEWAWVDMPFDADLLVSGLAVAPDGTVWVSGVGGVFSFDGVEWTRRFDHSAGGVAVAPDGTVWIGGGPWLARWDRGSWIPVGPVGSDSQEAPDMTGYAGASEGQSMPGVATSDGEVWMVAYVEGWPDCTWLLHYDGTALWKVWYFNTLRDGYFSGGVGSCRYVSADVAATPNGGIWTLMRVSDRDDSRLLLGRFDGEVWTTYTPPFADLDPMAVGPDGVVWFAVEGEGLVAFDGTDWTYPVPGQTVSAVDVAPDGTVWYIDQDGAHTLGWGASP